LHIGQAADRADESFRGLLLRYRGRAGLTQRDLVARLSASRRAVQDWEAGVGHPSAERLQALIKVLVEADGLTTGRESLEASELWAAVQRETPRMQTPFDQAWFAGVLSARAAPGRVPAGWIELLQPGPAATPEASSVERGQDWGEAPDLPDFVGRADELATLRGWVLEERCRLVAVLGIGGVGKTALTARFSQQVAPSFQRVYWRSLRDAPPASEWLAGAIGFLSDQQLVPPATESERLTIMLHLLRERRCLLVLDNFETLFESGQEEGRYRPGVAGYARLLQAVGEAAHQSCLVLTSREAPRDLAVLGAGVRALTLGGLGADEAQVLLASKGLSGTSQQWTELTARLGGNGLALKVAGESIRELFGGNLGSFLGEAGARPLFGGVRRLLAEQVERSSAAEQLVLRVLAVAREPVPLGTLLDTLEPRVGRGYVLEALEALRRRSLVERAETAVAAAFTLQSVVLEYMTDRLVETAAREIASAEQDLLVEQPVIEAQANDYVRQAQERLIGEPIIQRLEAHRGGCEPDQRLLRLLDGWRSRPRAEQGYGPGNVVNLLRLLRGHLCELDLSHLTIRQAHLAEVDARDARLVDAHLAETVLAEAFDYPTTVALSADGAVLLAGTSTGQVSLWCLADRTLLATLEGHTGAVWAVAMSADGRLLASGGTDGAVRLWEASMTCRLLAKLQGHGGAVWGVALSSDGRLVASGGTDGTVRLWEVGTRRPLTTLQGHTGAVWGVALSADGRLLASGGADGDVRIWETQSRRLLATFQGHTGGVRSVALCAAGHLLASGGGDGAMRLWEAQTGRLLATLQSQTGGVWGVALSADGHLGASGVEDGSVRLCAASGRPVLNLQGHTGAVRGVALSADGQLLASGGADGAMKLWEADTGRLLSTLQGHTRGVWGVALAMNGRLLASGGADGIVRLWEATTGRLLTALQGHTGAVWGVALASDGQWVVSGGFDEAVRLWEVSTGRLLATLPGHTGGAPGVVLAADRRLLASGGADGNVRVWEADSGHLLWALHGHTGGVRGVALARNGQLVASGGADGNVRLWEVNAGRLLSTLHAHTGGVWGVALSADGHLLASGGEDGATRLWDAQTERLLVTLQGHTGAVRGVALAADGRLLASGAEDGTVLLWEAHSGRLLATLRGHTSMVRGVALSSDGRFVASGGFDGAVRLWEASGGTCLRTLRAERRYERLDITGLTGVSDAQRVTLLALGAVDRVPAAAEGAGLVPRAPASVGRLTPREQEVATLVARGLTNRQIAERLVIVEGTADRHVSNILSKLTFRSRAQLAAWAVEQGLLSGTPV
jgi:WD40 repeat protein/DNA-binding CsgD family transcriptional regulator/transcriptional regulator with XRE-family HTH domain